MERNKGRQPMTAKARLRKKEKADDGEKEMSQKMGASPCVLLYQRMGKNETLASCRGG